MTNQTMECDANNDIYIGTDGQLAFALGPRAVELDCLQALKAQKYEMFLNPLGGMPTLDDVWLAKNFFQWESVARTTLTAINGVAAVQSFSISSNGDNFFYTVEILTVYSPTLLVITGKLGT